MLGTHILIHHSATPDDPDLDFLGIRKFHKEGRHWDDVGYHFVVERVNEEYVVVAGRPLNVNGAHCPGMNNLAYGVCFVGNFDLARPPKEQLEAGARFVAGLADQMKIPLERIEPHRDHRATACPGKHFPMGEFLKLVQKYRIL